MNYSPLTNSMVLTNNHGSRNGWEIDTITPHYMCWYCTGETCAESFVPASRRASATYCIGKYGDIVLNVPEEYKPWTTGSTLNDKRAITIECANYMETASGHVYGQLPDATWDSLVKLCADICQRYGKTRLCYVGDNDYNAVEPNGMLLTKHKWFQSTDCPGPWLDQQFDRLAAEVNALLDGSPVIIPTEEDEMICVFRPNDDESLPMCFYDGSKVHPIADPDELESVKMVYRETHDGKDIPVFSLGAKTAPYATRFINLIQRDW